MPNKEMYLEVERPSALLLHCIPEREGQMDKGPSLEAQQTSESVNMSSTSAFARLTVGAISLT